jgi:hypothetical protein
MGIIYSLSRGGRGVKEWANQKGDVPEPDGCGATYLERSSGRGLTPIRIPTVFSGTRWSSITLTSWSPNSNAAKNWARASAASRAFISESSSDPESLRTAIVIPGFIWKGSIHPGSFFSSAFLAFQWPIESLAKSSRIKLTASNSGTACSTAGTPLKRVLRGWTSGPAKARDKDCISFSRPGGLIRRRGRIALNISRLSLCTFSVRSASSAASLPSSAIILPLVLFALTCATPSTASPTINTRIESLPPFGPHQVGLSQDVKSWMPSPHTPRMTTANPIYPAVSHQNSDVVNELRSMSEAMESYPFSSRSPHGFWESLLQSLSFRWRTVGFGGSRTR